MPKKYETITKVNTMASFDTKDPCKDVFLRACRRWMKMGYRYTDNIPLDDLLGVAEELGEVQWLVDKVFIREVEPEVFYSVGDRFKFRETHGYRLVCSNADSVGNKPDHNDRFKVYMQRDTGYSYYHSFNVADPTKITEIEFNVIVAHNEHCFTKI